MVSQAESSESPAAAVLAARAVVSHHEVSVGTDLVLRRSHVCQAGKPRRIRQEVEELGRAIADNAGPRPRCSRAVQGTGYSRYRASGQGRSRRFRRFGPRSPPAPGRPRSESGPTRADSYSKPSPPAARPSTIKAHAVVDVGEVDVMTAGALHGGLRSGPARLRRE